MAAEFTVDQRSFLHLGVSTVIGAGTNGIMILGDIPQPDRLIISGATCFAVGAYKEFAIDGYPDYGDMTFNALGCLLGIGLTEGLTINLQRNGLNITGAFK